MKRSLRSWLWRVPLDQEIDEELSLHVEMRTRELVDRGMDPAAARELALRRMGDVTRVKKTLVELGRKRDRSMRITMYLEEFRDDVVFALRQLRSSPVFTAVAVLTLALGIGANSAIFALVDATLLRPLPYGDADRLVTIWETSGVSSRSVASPLNMLDWQTRGRSFETIAGYVPDLGGMVMAGADGNAETVSRQWVSGGIFDVLGVKAIAGRTFLPSDDEQKKNVVVLSEAFWQTRFNRDPSVVGSDIRLDGTLFTVVGVVPKEFQILGRTSMWASRPYMYMPPRGRASYMLHAVGRLKSGVTLEAAEADLQAVAAGLAQEYPQFNKGRSVALEPLRDSMIGGDLKTTSLLFLGVVGFVLLICCANVANLLLARASARTNELGIRAALGAGRGRIIRQLLTESVVLAAIGGVLGAMLGAAILRVAPVIIPEGLLPATVTPAFDARVVGFCAVAALAVGIIFGLAPAWQASSSTSPQLLGSPRTTTGGGHLRRLLVAGEVAMAVLLLFGAGLLLRTLVAVNSFDRGYRAQSVLTMLVDPLGSTYPTPERLLQFFDQVEAEVRAVPGVADVGWSTGLPLGDSVFGEYPFHYQVVGDAPLDDAHKPTADYQVVSPAYFSTLQLPIVAGRGFDGRETRGSPKVVIVNEAFARSLGGRNPIGLQVSFRPVDAPPGEQPVVAEIVGVARQVKRRPDESTDFVQVYAPIAHQPIGDMVMLVRSATGRAEALTSAVRAAISRIDKEQLVSVRDVQTIESVDWAATGRHRFRATLVTAFATLALVLAMVGVFGILAYSVQQRTRDFGVRRALGASTNDVMRLVASDAARVVFIGAAAGLVLAAAMSRLIDSVLFGVQPLDVPTFALVIVVLSVTALLAIAGPAWRASRIDPARALRQ